MPKKCLRCLVEINLHGISSPGTWLVKRDDLYVTVKLFDQIRQTRFICAIFPIVLHEKFKFDKVFYKAYEPSQVAEALEDLTVRIELIQVSTYYEDGRLLAWHEGSARDFLYPYPHYNVSYGTSDREILLERTLSFPGISPRLEFSTKTVIQQTVAPMLESWDVDDEVATHTTSQRRSRSRTRSRSVSPSLSKRMSEVSLDDGDTTNVEDRPPFVVRKVDNSLIGRNPGTIVKRSLSTERKSSSSEVPGTHVSNSDKFSDSYKRRPYWPYEYYYYTDLDRDLVDSAYYRQLRSSALSPAYYRSAWRDYWDERSTSPTYAELIRERVRRALRRDHALQDLDHLRPYRSYSRMHDTITDLELELELARRRKYYV